MTDLPDRTASDHSPEDIAKAQAVAVKIEAKVTALLEPLAREVRIMGWPPEYAAIMWEAVAMKAMARAQEAQRG